MVVYLLYLLYFVVSITIAFTGLLYLYQCDLLYPAFFPSGSRSVVARPSQYGLPDKEEILVTPDGVRLRSYILIQRDDGVAIQSPTILCLHAHTGNMGHRLPIAQVFYKKLGYNVVMLSYRGYGLSEGKASEKGLQIDAQTILGYIQRHPILKHTKLVAYGQSLGGAVAVDLVSKNEHRFHALIIENTFLSIPTLIPHVFPPLRHLVYLVHQEWKSYRAIKFIRQVPILFLSSLKDELVPPSHMRKLYKGAETAGLKMWREFENGTHNDTCMQEGYFDCIGEFIRDNVWEVE
ncbi:Alpha/Beta hydrolase protein [Syncephalastrum racemosum]|uniref:Alpha/Beta hydrolase protein n=1 Tax=Syncephalastrum racemosum TaxID=13706 RepID=A0A1X2H067_SYNRA|nr:Alpha/Beta hydrolase protein [Syncephalastrum racemosum]